MNTALNRPGRRPNREAPREEIRDENEIREGMPREPKLVRPKYRNGDRFYIDPTKIPDGMSYEWKATSIMNEPDRDKAAECAMFHWTPVPAYRHPEYKLASVNGNTIEIGGQTLMERPSYLTDEAARENIDEGINRVRAQYDKLTATSAEGFEARRPNIQTVYERLPQD